MQDKAFEMQKMTLSSCKSWHFKRFGTSSIEKNSRRKNADFDSDNLIFFCTVLMVSVSSRLLFTTQLYLNWNKCVAIIVLSNCYIKVKMSSIERKLCASPKILSAQTADSKILYFQSNWIFSSQLFEHLKLI